MLRIISADKFISSRFILEYSKAEFASLLGVSVAKISNIESGKSSIPPRCTITPLIIYLVSILLKIVLLTLYALTKR